MPVCGSVGGVEPLWEWNGLLPREPFVENQCGGQGGRAARPNLVGGGGGGGGRGGRGRRATDRIPSLEFAIQQ